MAVDEHQYLGAIDGDSPDQKILPGYHRTSRNIIWKGTHNGMRAESVVGTTQVTNPGLPAAGGTNLCIGAFYDQGRQRIIIFNYNSAGTHGIYIYNTILQTWQTLIQTGTNTSGDPLGFTATGRIHSIDVIYGDNNSGDLLFYVDSLKRPSKININRFLGQIPGLYNPIARAFLNVIKAPPVQGPRVTYENDYTVNANNLTNSLFQFAYTYIYDDYEESVLSTASKVPLPTAPFSNTVNLPVSNNARISLYLQTGDQNVSKIRIYMRQTQNGIQSGWFIVDTIVKTANGISNNSIYRYLFFNSGNYIPADPLFTVLLYDIVPQQANSQALLAGTTIAYGAITEGYPYFSSQFSENLAGYVNFTGVFYINGMLFFADYNGLFTGSQPQIEIVLTGAGTNDANGNPVNLVYAATNFAVRAKSNGTDVSFSYNNIGATVNIPTLLTAISGAAVSSGWVLVSTGTNSFVIYYPTGTVVLQSSYSLSINPPTPSSTIFSFYPQSNYALGVEYFDANGITNGVITDVTANVSTLSFIFLGNVTTTRMTVNLSVIVPPARAVYYRLVRTDTLTYSKHLNWVSNQAFSNVGMLVTNQYAYIGISNIADYNLQINATQGVVGYEFQQGDRIKIIGRFDSNQAFYVINTDYTVLGTVVNPVINGVSQAGTFIQIAYPAADIGTNFQFINSYNAVGYADFQNYLILLYHITQNINPQTENTGTTQQQGNVFYEFGETYGIMNPGTINAYHMGNLSDNQITFSDGDVFFRQRTVPSGQTFYINVFPSNFSNRYITAVIPLTPPIIVGGKYLIGTQNGNAASIVTGTYPNFSDTGFFFENLSGATETIRLRGTMPVGATGPTFTDVYVKINTSTSTILIPVVVNSQPIIQAPATPIDIVIDATFGVPSGGKCWFILGNGTQVANINIYQFQLRIDVQNNITINVFDPSYSDIYNLITNSDNRPTVQDTFALTSYFSTLFRYSEPYQLGTNINNTNRFYPNNYDEFDKSYGDIIRMRARQKELRIFQYRRTGRVGVYANFIKDNQGNTSLVTTDKIITQDNIQYFEGEYGIGNQFDGLCSSGFADYFPDPIKAAFIRVSLNGVENITHELTQGSKIQIFAGATLPLYLSQYSYPFGGNAVILGCYNFASDRDSEAVWVLQGGTSVAGNLTGQSIAFVEAGNRWSSFYDFSPDAIVCAENVLYSFYNGVMYVHNNTGTYCNFYGVQYFPSITLIKNDNPLLKKTWISVGERSNAVWDAIAIHTDLNSYGSIVQQQSNLVDEDFVLLEEKFHAPFLRDINSIGGLINGDALKGTILAMTLQPSNGANFIYLSMAEVKYISSPVIER